MKNLVLAYSGGLDTSYCVKYLTAEKFQVHTVTVNTGGFTADELKALEDKATALGAVSHTAIDATSAYYSKIVRYMIFGNILKNDTYPLSVSSERVLQAIEVAKYTKKTVAAYIAHGSTGAGNDQVRFDMIFRILIPDVEIISPVRDAHLSRQDEIAYLKKHGITISWDKARYSINKGLWGTSIGGAETLSSHLSLPEEAYPHTLQNTKPQKVKLHFEKGELIGINDNYDSPLQNIITLNTLASDYAIGRDVHTGDTIIGIKGRVAFEAAAPLIIIKAHHTLEKHVLTKWQLYLKKQLSEWYGMLLHEGQYLDPVMRNIEAFLDDSQQTVSGIVYVSLHPYRFVIEGIDSKHDLMNAAFGQYGEQNKAWTADDAKGFIKILSNQSKIYEHVNKFKYD